MDVETNFEPQPEDPLGTINPEQHDGYAALIEDGRRVLDIARLKNRNHKATWAITICISGAVHRGRTIIGVAAKMSFQSSEHIRVILAKGLAAGDWVKDEAGLYQLPQEPLTH